MNPLHEYVAKQLFEKLKKRGVVVWYDLRAEFAPFVAEVRGGPHSTDAVVPVTIFDLETQLAEYDGSFFKLRSLVEPIVSGDSPEGVWLYIPGCARDRRGSVLMELDKAGECYKPQLKRLARNVLRQRYTDGVIDEILAPERVTYEDLARAASDTSSPDPPSILKSIFHDTRSNDALITTWLASDARDAEIAEKEAVRELAKLVRSRVGLELPEDASLAKHRSITLRYVLASEFRSDLTCPPPATLDSVPEPKTKDEAGAVLELARVLRRDFADIYPQLADGVEAELGFNETTVPPEALGAVDTFRFEERALLGHCAALVAESQFEKVLDIVGLREHSFWLDRDVVRKAQWEACRRMAELGTTAAEVRAAVAKVTGDPDAWIEAYAATGGWYRLDQAQRRLEAWVATLDDEPDERALGVVRRAYEDVCHAMAEGFTKALVKAKWATSHSLHQTRVFSEIVSELPKPVAYFLVDAMRYEMGVELADRLPKTAEVSTRPAVGALPSITPIGMAALQPEAAGSFSIEDQQGRLGARIDGVFLPDVGARRKFAAARVPKLVDVALDDLLSLQPSKLRKKLKEAQVVVVRSQEIDHAGETGFARQARRIMDEVIGDIASAIHRLAKTGVQAAVVTADHGHLFFAEGRDESMRTDAPGGDQVDLHRRCWIGRGGATPPGCVRVSSAALGYDSDLELVFPTGSGVFRAGGDLAFHHGGPSLQEMIIPVLTVRMQVAKEAGSAQQRVTVAGLPAAVTNRIFSASLVLGGQQLTLGGMDDSSMSVRPVLMSGGRQVGAVGMAIEADLDRATGCVTLEPGQPVSVAFLLSDDEATSLRVVVQDPATDAELYRSPDEIPVRLGM